MSKRDSPERRWAATWQSGLERYSPPMVGELQEMIRTLPGINPDAAELAIALYSWVPPNRACVVIAMHNGRAKEAAAAYNAAYERLVEQATEERR